MDPITPEPDIRVYNKNTSRTFIHGEYRLAPSSFLTVPVPIAKLWMSRPDGDVMEASVAQSQLGGVTAELQVAKARIADLEAQVAQLQADADAADKALVKGKKKPTSDAV